MDVFLGVLVPGVFPAKNSSCLWLSGLSVCPSVFCSNCQCVWAQIWPPCPTFRTQLCLQPLDLLFVRCRKIKKEKKGLSWFVQPVCATDQVNWKLWTFEQFNSVQWKKRWAVKLTFPTLAGGNRFAYIYIYPWWVRTQSQFGLKEEDARISGSNGGRWLAEATLKGAASPKEERKETYLHC